MPAVAAIVASTSGAQVRVASMGRVKPVPEYDDSRTEGVVQLRVPPHSIEAEHALLGGLMLDNSAWDRAGDLLTDSDFYRYEHKAIYKAIGDLLSQTKPADVITVFERLQAQGKAEECGGVSYINALAHSVPSAANILRYAEIVRERAALRKLIEAADAIASLAFSDAADPRRVLEEACELVEGIQKHTIGQRADPFKIVDMAALSRDDDLEQEWPWEFYVPAGHPTVLASHGGLGKSTASAHIAVCVGMGAPCFGRPTMRTRVLYYSAEDPASLVLKRMRSVCRALGFPFSEVAEWVQVIDATDLAPVLFTERRIDGVRQGGHDVELRRARRVCAARGIRAGDRRQRFRRVRR
jgi:hypothetical protein